MALEGTDRTLASGDRRPSDSMAALHAAVFLDPPCLFHNSSRLSSWGVEGQMKNGFLGVLRLTG